MTFSRSDRPYGQFPRGEAPEPAPPPDAPRRVPLRERIVARLRARDIAVLRALAPPAQFQPATLGNPGSLSIGDPAFVIGHPFGLTGSLSTGVISGLGRSMTAPNLSQPITGLIQFDAAVNPGNSGGPLVDQKGDVVGIVTGLVNPAGKVFSGVGFAVT